MGRPAGAKGSSEELKNWQAKVAAWDQSMNSDDLNGWPMVQRPLNGVLAQEAPLRYFNTFDETVPDGWPGPGEHIYSGSGSPAGDDNQWLWWKNWFDMMTTDETE